MNTMPAASAASRNALFSERNPKPGCTASAPLVRHASTIASIRR